MIAVLAAAAAVLLPPDAVLAKYQAALAALIEPRVFSVEYTLEQMGTRSVQQTHRIFRSGSDERDEILAVNGNRLKSPTVRIFRGRRYRYAASTLAPKPAAYTFTYAGTHKDGRHVDYVFRLAPKAGKPAFALTQVAVDGVSFLPASVSFATTAHEGRGSVTFAKSEKYWVASGASASAHAAAGTALERLTFSGWRFPASLPRSTFAAPRPLPTLPPAQ